MMHAMGLHSALAIKRQRKRREEQKRARERRFSSQSTESGLGESRSSFASPRNSTGSLDRRRGSRKKKRPAAKIVSTDSKVASGVGMLHIGVVFIVLGLFLLGSAMVPDDFDTWQYHNKERVYEFIFSGLACFLIGIFLIGVNKIITSKEERDLSDYVERQLTRSRSGHRLIRDSETGGLTSSRPPKSPIMESVEFESDKTPNGCTPRSPPPISVTTPRSDLERILEEEISDSKYDTKTEKHISNGRYYDSMPVYED